MDGLDENLIVQYPLFESLRLIVRGMKAPFSLNEKLVGVCNETMNRFISKHFTKNVDAMVGFSGSCLETFKAVKQRGIKCVLDQPIAFVDDASEILKEEVLNSGFKTTINLGIENEKWKKNRREETRLADLILCGSSFVWNSLVKFGFKSEKVRVVPYGVDASRSRKTKEQNFVYCLLVQ